LFVHSEVKLKNLVVTNVIWNIPYIKFKCILVFIALFAGWREEVQKRFRKGSEEVQKRFR
jgi:hypothetical protein